MHAILQFLIDQPLFTLFLLVGLGATIGRVKVRGISLGAAAVLFVAMGFTALCVGQGFSVEPDLQHLLETLETAGNLGLALFTFTVGVISGPSFFASLRTGLGPIAGAAAGLVAAAGVCLGVGTLLNLPHPSIAGAFAGSMTNTPALAAAIQAAGNPDQNNPTVAYSVTYLFGVLGILGLTMLALRQVDEPDPDTPVTLTNLTIRVEQLRKQGRVRDIESRFDHQITFSNLRRGDTSPIQVLKDDDIVLQEGDLVTVVGPPDLIAEVARYLGHASSHNLYADRKASDLRRITLSDHRLAGRTVDQLQLVEKFGAVVTRVRRGDVDMLAHGSLILQAGDRLRVIAPSKRLKEVSRYLGDSARGLTDINPIGLGLGMATGIALGAITIPIGTGFTLGSAAGTLLVGLVFGRLGRIGPVITALPHTAATVLSELGLFVFLAFAGARAGGQIVTYWDPNQIFSLLLVGALATMTMGVVTYLVMRRIFHLGRTRLAGLLGGVQTQPAILAYANERTGFDSRIALGYALVYPTSMVIKILLAQVLGGL